MENQNIHNRLIIKHIQKTADFRKNQSKGGLHSKESILRARFLSVFTTRKGYDKNGGNADVTTR